MKPTEPHILTLLHQEVLVMLKPGLPAYQAMGAEVYGILEDITWENRVTRENFRKKEISTITELILRKGNKHFAIPVEEISFIEKAFTHY